MRDTPRHKVTQCLRFSTTQSVSLHLMLRIRSNSTESQTTVEMLGEVVVGLRMFTSCSALVGCIKSVIVDKIVHFNKNTINRLALPGFCYP